MSGVLIIGYGNPLRGDDGIGVCAAEAFEAEITAGTLPEGYPLTILTRMQLTPELAEPVHDADLVIFIDACVEGEPGTVREEDLAPTEGGALTHHVYPGTLLALAQELYGNSPKALVISVAGGDFGYESGLSAAVAATLPHLTKRLAELALGQTGTH